MDTKLKQQHTDCTDETLLFTPKPRASSTIEKRQLPKKVELKKIPLSYSPNTSEEISANSLGILHLDSIQLTCCLSETTDQGEHPHVTNEKLISQRNLANSILQKTSKSFGLPSRYLRPSDSIKLCDSPTSALSSDTTINETDLLQEPIDPKMIPNSQEEKVSFAPGDISTPRSSSVSDVLHSPRTAINKGSMSKSLAQLKHHIQNSTMSLSELCERFQNSSLDSTNLSIGSECNDESFVPGELAGAKMAEHELSWRKQLDILGGNSMKSDSLFSQLENYECSKRDESLSVSEFFRKRSELADLCLKRSPERASLPTPLIDNSVVNGSEGQDNAEKLLANSSKTELADESILSITEIEKVISSTDNTTNLVDLMFGKEGKKASKGSFRSPKDINYSNKYLVSNNKGSNCKENVPSSKNVDIGLIPRSASAEPLKDSGNISAGSNSLIRTASSLESLPGGKLPIETNRTELVWGCVQIGKRKTQTFILRNKSQSKIRLQISSSNTSFRILNDQAGADPVSALPVLMYPAESRSFTVMFAPTAIGAVAERLNFAPISTELLQQQTKRQQLMMYGYGGHTHIEIQNVPKDTNMKMWLSLGKLDNRSQLSQKFGIQNMGSLAAFCCLNFTCKSICGGSRVTIYPMEVVLKTKERAMITVTYTPTKDDAKHVFAMTGNPVTEIGFIQVITGDEPLRGRIRRLCKKLKQEGSVIGNPLVERLSKIFPNEKLPCDLNRFTETVGSMKELMQNLLSKEISLTLEKNSECTLLGQIADFNETSQFHSLTEGMSTILCSKTQVGACTVEPTNLVLTPPVKTEDSILIICHSANPLQFQTTVTPPDVLQVTPFEGILTSGETIFVKVGCDLRKLQKQQQLFKILIYIDDEVFQVDVKVILVKSKVVT